MELTAGADEPVGTGLAEPLLSGAVVAAAEEEPVACSPLVFVDDEVVTAGTEEVTVTVWTCVTVAVEVVVEMWVRVWVMVSVAVQRSAVEVESLLLVARTVGARVVSLEIEMSMEVEIATGVA